MLAGVSMAGLIAEMLSLPSLPTPIPSFYTISTASSLPGCSLWRGTSPSPLLNVAKNLTVASATAKYTVRVSKHHCGQTFSNYLGG